MKPKRKVMDTRQILFLTLLLSLPIFTLSATNGLADVIVDNGTSGTSSTGVWQISGGSSPYGANSYWSRDGSTYTWQFDSQPAGEYEVLMWWSQWPSRGTDIDVTISSFAADEIISINQYENAGQWNSLGTYSFGTSGSVTITAAYGSTVSTCADAVWFRLVSENLPPTATIDSVTPNPAEAGQTINFTGHGQDSDGSITAYNWESSIDGNLSNASSFSTNTLSEGVHTIFFEVQDNQGAWSQAASEVLTVGEVPVEIIVDNRDIDTSQTGAWEVSGGSNPYSVDSVWSRDGGTFTWYFTPPQNGEYEVSMWWTEWPSRSTAAPVDIVHAGGTERIYINQQQDGGQWNYVGTYIFNTDGDGLVTIVAEDTAPTSYCADAVKFNYIQINDAPIATIDSIIPNPADLGDLISFVGHGDDTDGSIQAYNWQSSIDGNLSNEAAFSTNTLTEGQHIISFRVQDNEGKWSSFVTEALIIGTISPTAYIDSITPNPAYVGQTINFTGHGQNYDGSITGYNWESSIDGNLSNSSSFSTNTLSEGVHTIFFEVQDNQGTWSQPASEVLTVSEVPVEIIVDNRDLDTSETGTWEVSGGSNPYSVDSVWSRDGGTFTWYFTPPQNGEYEVSMWWTEWPSRSTAAPVDITHAGGTERIYINQQQNGGQWNYLGTYVFNTDGDGLVTIIAEDAAPTSYCADAVKFNYIQTNYPPIAKIDSITPNPADVNEVVSFIGHGEDDDSNIVDCLWVSSIDGNLNDVNCFSTSSLSLGEHVISFYVYNDKGEVSQPATQILIKKEPVSEIIIDNDDPNTYYTGTWSVSGASGAYDSNSLWSRDGTTFTWRFTPEITGYYDVSMWWTEWPSRTTDAPVLIPHADGADTVYCNQQQNGGQWNKIGDYNFEALTSYDITITSMPEPASTCADAIRFLKIPEPGSPVADFYADRTRGAAPFSIQYNNQSIGQVTEWLWDFGDGQTSSLQSPSHTYTLPGVHTVSLTMTGPYGTNKKIRYSYVDIKPDSAENIYLIDGYAGNDLFIKQVTVMLRGLGATETSSGWIYQPDNSNMTYYIYVVHDPQGMLAALAETDSHLIIEGHANYGFGLIFASPSEIWTQTIEDFYFVDDDRIVLYGTDMVSTKYDGMKYGQAYPNWEPVFKDGTSALMPYDFGDPRGNPPYNYYLTYTIPGDPNTYKIELSNGDALERFPDSGVPAWFSADGSPPDPIENPEYFIINSDVDFNRFEAVGEWVIKKEEEGGYSGDLGYMGYNYQVQWPGFGDKVATWNMVIKYPGLYRVMATWFPDPTNATNARYTINHSEGSTTVMADQTVTESRNSLGLFNFDAGSHTVQLNDNANGQVVADAVILRPVADAELIFDAEFRANITSGPAPLGVQFTDRSYHYSYDYTGDINEWHWDFGDGSVSDLEDPNHIYTEPGLYTVTLTIVDTNGLEESTEIKTDFIAVGVEPPLEAEFYASRRRGTQNTNVRFYDQSSGDVNEWHWDFGDGNTSDEQNPVHLYTIPGTYTVSLTVSGPGGSDTETEENYIYNFFGESYTDNTFKIKPHFYSRGYSTFGKIICDTGDVKVREEDLGYSRMFHGACNSFQYFTETFHRGVIFAKSRDVKEEDPTGVNYLEYYLRGYTDYDILEYLNTFENIHEYYDFNLKPPSLR